MANKLHELINSLRRKGIPPEESVRISAEIEIEKEVSLLDSQEMLRLTMCC